MPHLFGFLERYVIFFMDISGEFTDNILFSRYTGIGKAGMSILLARELVLLKGVCRL